MAVYEVGQLVKVSTVVRGPDGDPADATVALTVTAPDGTVTNPAVAHGGVGEYSASIPATQAGDWLFRWVASGAITSASEDQFSVRAGGLMILSLDELKEHLNIASSTVALDNELRTHIAAAQAVIETLAGPMVPRTVTRVCTPYGDRVLLTQRPVLSVSSVVEFRGATPVTLTQVLDLAAGTPAANEYWLDQGTGVLSRMSMRRPHCFPHGLRTVAVTYRAGRSPIPEAAKMAAKEQAAHLFQQSQVAHGSGSGGSRFAGAPEQPAATILGYAVPTRVIEYLRPYRRPGGIG